MYSNRWWESYLVRYFMPSIAGIGIVSFLVAQAGPGTRSILFFGDTSTTLTAQTLILLILYGNLFCYIASYPILGFHATRVIDQQDSTWRPKWFDGYLMTAVVGCLAIAILRYGPAALQIPLMLSLVSAFSLVQVIRVARASVKRPLDGLREDSSLAFGYVFALAKRRGSLERSKSRTTRNGTENSFTEDNSDRRVTHWHREMVESYRHMREHGNSAYIFVLELVLAAICFVVVLDKSDAQEKLSMIAVIFGIWAVPAVSVHLMGQSLERRFSLFDRRLESEARQFETESKDN